MSKFTRPKIALIGAGAIGGNMALLTGVRDLADVVLFDLVQGMPSGKALDLSQTSPILKNSASFQGCNDYEGIKGADVVIVTAGLTKAPGKSDNEWNRDQLLPFNAAIMRKVGAGIKEFCPHAFVICITNPLDCMVKVLQEASGVSDKKICGMAGVLDTSRFRRFLADALKVSPADVQALVIGAHGEAMIPLPRYCSVNGIPLSECIRQGMITQAQVDAIVMRTTHGGKEIVQLLGQGSAFYAPAAAAIEMAESYLRDQKRVLPCAAKLSGQYGINDMFLGVPCVIGCNGIERILEIQLDEKEKKLFDGTVADVRALIDKLGQMEAEHQAE